VSRRRPYTLRDPDLNRALDALLGEAARRYERSANLDLVREMIVTALRLLHDDASRGDLRLANAALKELRHAFRVFAPYRPVRKVAVFGSARTPGDDARWEAARIFSERIVEAGWMVITGAGGGIMAAAQGGAGREASFGVNIRLPFEQKANETIAGDEKLINFRYFFTRKVTFVKEAHAIVLLPGGFGTLDEGFEALTLIQTGKSEILPVVFLDEPGGDFWQDWFSFVRRRLLGEGMISDEDFSLFTVCDEPGQAVEEISRFYRNYHSSRHVRERLVIRLHRAPSPDELDMLNEDFADLVRRGRIEATAPLPEEGGEVADYPRIVLHLDRQKVGRLRELIDRLNSLVPEPVAPPRDALPHEIVVSNLDVVRAQEEEEA